VGRDIPDAVLAETGKTVFRGSRPLPRGCRRADFYLGRACGRACGEATNGLRPCKRSL